MDCTQFDIITAYCLTINKLITEKLVPVKEYNLRTIIYVQ